MTQTIAMPTSGLTALRRAAARHDADAVEARGFAERHRALAGRPGFEPSAVHATRFDAIADFHASRAASFQGQVETFLALAGERAA